jgi:hypothetical protein
MIKILDRARESVLSVTGTNIGRLRYPDRNVKDDNTPNANATTTSCAPRVAKTVVYTPRKPTLPNHNQSR